MSYEEFKRFINEDKIKEASQYVSDKYHELSEISLSDHFYDILLSYYLNGDSSIIVKLKYPWKYFFHINPNQQITKEDLELERIIGLKDSYVYFGLIKSFLQENDVIDIPTSFLEHYNELEVTGYYSSYSFIIFNLIMNDIYCDFKSFWDNNLGTSLHDNSYYLKLVELFIMMINKYDFECILSTKTINEGYHNDIIDSEDENSSIGGNTRSYVFDVIVENMNMFTHYDDDTGVYILHGQEINDENIIGFFLNLPENEINELCTLDYFLKSLCNYFEWMSMSEQISIWNILKNIDEYLLLSTIVSTTSEIFIDFIFDQYDKLKTMNDDLLPFNFDDTIESCYIIKLLQVHPESRNTLVIYYFMNNIEMYNELFSNTTDREIVDILKEHFNL